MTREQLSARQAGRDAFHSGQALSDNPHESRTFLWFEWNLAFGLERALHAD